MTKKDAIEKVRQFVLGGGITEIKTNKFWLGYNQGFYCIMHKDNNSEIQPLRDFHTMKDLMKTLQFDIKAIALSL